MKSRGGGIGNVKVTLPEVVNRAVAERNPTSSAAVPVAAAKLASPA